MRPVSTKSWRTAAALLIMAGTAHADLVVGDFEGTDPGTWGYWSGGVQAPLEDDPNLALSTEQATSGLTSVKATNAGWDQNLAYAADLPTREQFLNYSALAFDVVFPETTDGGFWEIFELVINSNAGFNNVTAGMTNSDGGTNQVGWPVGGGALRTVTFTVDYASQLALWNGSTPGWLELVFALNNDSVHSIAYIDNVRLVPEPATLALLGVVLLAIRRRRA